MKDKRNRNCKSSQKPPQEEKRHQKLSDFLDIPSAALSGVMQIQISGNTEAVVEGCTGVLEYNENVIRLAGGKMSVKFAGRGLQFKVLTHDSAIIGGFIMGLEYIL